MMRRVSGVAGAMMLGSLAVGVAQTVPILQVDRFAFRLPALEEFRLEQPPLTGVGWIKAAREDGSGETVEFGSRVVVQLMPGASLRKTIGEAALVGARGVNDGLFIVPAADALAAMREAQRLSRLEGVRASYPVMRKRAELHGPYAAMPKDRWFDHQWPLENRATNGVRLGLDLNARAAWPWSKGQGVTIAVADTGVELAHPELTARVVAGPHTNFASGNGNAMPMSRLSQGAHGTQVAGLAAASLNNHRMAGVAPEAGLASWVIFHTDSSLASDDELMEMYQYAPGLVDIQNHSWGHPGLRLRSPTVLEEVGLQNAVTLGRNGKGVVMVRSAGNDRMQGANACDDGYPNDPRVITVAAVRPDGRVCSYSEPGACVLVGAPSGDPAVGLDGLLSTDLLGTDGANPISFFPPDEDLSDYVFYSMGFSGTSAAVPQIAGVVALMLSVNPGLTYRDVQQVLALSARHFDYADPDVVTNGAGFVVSHNLGFGVPDAAQAVTLARTWVNRPTSTRVVSEAAGGRSIPDDGLRLLVSGPGVPPWLTSIQTLPGTGLHPDTPTPSLPLQDFGYGTNLAGYDLTNKGALIQRGAPSFAGAISLAAQAGAAFAVVYNYPGLPPGGDQLVNMGGTDFVPIPAVFIGNTAGEALKALFQTNQAAVAEIRLQSTEVPFVVTDTLMCESVGLRLMTDHPLRGDLRVTLVSPSGTRSVLQKYNADTSPGPVDWTYYSTHHFFESSAGTWTAYISDEGAGAAGTVLGINLVIDGVPIQDQDRDGLDDLWELEHFGSLAAQNGAGDPDGDFYGNSREQVMRTDPLAVNQEPFGVDLSRWNATLGRLSWPSRPGVDYEVLSASTLDGFVVLTNLPGAFPETELIVPISGPGPKFYRIRTGGESGKDAHE